MIIDAEEFIYSRLDSLGDNKEEILDSLGFPDPGKGGIKPTNNYLFVWLSYEVSLHGIRLISFGHDKIVYKYLNKEKSIPTPLVYCNIILSIENGLYPEFLNIIN